MQKRVLLGIGFIGMLLSFRFSFAQSSSEALTAENINRFVSVGHIDFAYLPTEAGIVQSGWFALSRTGDRMTVKNSENELITLDFSGKIIDQYMVPGSDGLPTTIEDAAYNPAGDMLASIHLEGGAFYIAYRWLNANYMDYYRVDTQDVPIRVWSNEHVWLEVSPYDSATPRYVLQLNPRVMDRLRQNESLEESEMTRLPSGPENDPESYLRIGRLPPPVAVTITQSYLTKRWNLETGAVTASAQVDELPGAGQLSASGRYFAWRDGEAKALHLLDFETGEDKIVTELNGTYLPFLILNPTADVILSVDTGLEPVVTAWNSTTRGRYDLGEYRTCNRQPDIVRLSGDGTTLVIGCDTGLDLWRVSE